MGRLDDRAGRAIAEVILPSETNRRFPDRWPGQRGADVRQIGFRSYHRPTGRNYEIGIMSEWATTRPEPSKTLFFLSIGPCVREKR